MAQNIYYLISSLGVIFTLSMSILTYRFNKKAKESELKAKKSQEKAKLNESKTKENERKAREFEEQTRLLADEIKRIYEIESKARHQVEIITKILEQLSTIGSYLDEMNQSNKSIAFNGVNISSSVEKIHKIVMEISEYSYIFIENKGSFDTGDYEDLEKIIDNHNEATRKSILKSIIRFNTSNKNFLRKIQNDL